MYRKLGKRLLDLTLSSIVLGLVWPLLLLLHILVRRNLGSPALFAQPRLGKDGRVFTLYKFRTMTDERDANGQLLPDSQRLTRFGRFLRSSSLDELPELYNVLAGEMSLVGPRPLLVQYRDRYSPEQWRRHEVLPGITGLTQVSGRNLLAWEEKFRLDVFYVDHQSFWLDCSILLRTALKVAVREGISSPGNETSPEFTR
ncbi:sugar transferase [bacterium CPR1]|nr:sugar transferase [bacterium CPR1]